MTYILIRKYSTMEDQGRDEYLGRFQTKEEAIKKREEHNLECQGYYRHNYEICKVENDSTNL